MISIPNPTKVQAKSQNTSNVSQIRFNIFKIHQYSGGNYYHFKTNVPKSGAVMASFEFVGNNFGGGQKLIRSMASFYAYPTIQYPYNACMNDCYNGFTLQQIYYTQDNYVAICGLTDYYYTGLTVNAYSCNPGSTGFDCQILAFAQTQSTAAAW